ncbi:MAG: hypothetical protein H7039_02710 [Bryobacteraceae bacterium]|nr:hypothetical protein [Bryobacteraceae bacterium]
MKSTFLLIAAVSVTAAQIPDLSQSFQPNAFSGLSTNRDGSMLVFSSPLQLRGVAGQVAWEKIFSWTEKDSVRLLAQRPAGRFSSVHQRTWDGSEPYHLLRPSLSSDGQIVSFVGQKDCSFGTPCAVTVERWETTVRFADGTENKFPGSARLSANGRYALAQSSRLWGVEFSPDVAWVNVRTGQSVVSSLSKLAVSGSRPVADDGSTVRRVPGGFELWRPGFDPFRPTETKPLSGLPNAGPILLSSDARVVITNISSGMVAYDIASGLITPISPSPGEVPLDISEDGSAVLLRDAASYRVFRRDGSGFRDLTFPDSVREIILSGDGKMVFAIVDGSAIVRIEVATGRVSPVVPTTPFGLARTDGPPSGQNVTRGSVLRLISAGDPRFGPEQYLLPGHPATTASFGGQSWPVLASDPNGASVQVPWEAPLDADPNYVQLKLKPANEASPFEAAWILLGVVKVVANFPEWFLTQTSRTTSVLAAHEDFGSLVSPASPARAGEVIHVYGTGFGEVTPVVPTGQPAPGNPLSRVTGDLQCRLGQSGREPLPVEVFFAGLAPGLTGIYQLDLRIPTAVSGPEGRLTCRIEQTIASGQLPTRP